MKVVIIGGGSFTWSFGFVRQFVNSSFKDLTVVLMDINKESLQMVASACQIYNQQCGNPIKIESTMDINSAREDGDYVIVSISTGGLDTMRADIEIPEKYGIWHTVGDTVGPGGWSRAVRNIPVFDDIAAKMKKYCPNAWLINVSNPLTVLTRVPHRNYGIKTIGMCPGVENQAKTFAEAAGLPSDAKLDFVNSGIDHHSYFISLYANGIDVLKLLKDKGYCRADGVLPAEIETKDPLAENTINRVIFAIWNELGFLPSISDRHAVENYPNFIVNDTGKLSFNIKRTSIADRKQLYAKAKQAISDFINSNGKNGLGSLGHGDDPVVRVIEALSGKGSFLWCSNYKNIGQIEGLPENAVVETRCLFDSAGVHPLALPMPDTLKAVVLPHVLRQEAIIDIALTGSFKELVAIVMSDPLCCRLKPGQVSEMIQEMLLANKQYIKNSHLF